MEKVIYFVKLSVLSLVVMNNLKRIHCLYHLSSGIFRISNNDCKSSAMHSIWERKICRPSSNQPDTSLHYHKCSMYDVAISKVTIRNSALNTYKHKRLPKSIYMMDMDRIDGTKHLSAEFKTLSKGKSYLEFGDFLKWEEIQALLADDLLSMGELKSLWLKYVGSLTYSIDKPTFFKMNEDLDNMFEEVDDEEEDEDEEVVDENNVEFSDIWDLSVDSSKVFPKEFIAYLSIFHSKHATAEGLLSYHSFREWKDINELMAEGSVDVTCLKDVWQEALIYKSKHSNGGSGDATTAALSTSNNDFALKKNFENEKYMVDLDTFIRVNFRLEEVMEEIRKALSDLSSEDVRAYYSGEFEALAGGEGLLSYQQLMDWTVVQEVLHACLHVCMYICTYVCVYLSISI